MHRNSGVTFITFTHFVINLLIFRHLCVPTCPGRPVVVLHHLGNLLRRNNDSTLGDKTNKRTSLSRSLLSWVESSSLGDKTSTTHVFALIISFNNDYIQQPRRLITTQQSRDGNEAKRRDVLIGSPSESVTNCFSSPPAATYQRKFKRNNVSAACDGLSVGAVSHR